MKKGLYIHIPFCKRKCKYCDFVSFCAGEGEINRYFDALFSQMRSFEGEEINSVFIGGGTPSLIDKRHIKALFENIKNVFELDKNCEITIEANPSSLEEEKICTYLECGINRISMGIQSFSDNELEALGRLHDADEAYKKAEFVKKCGFKNINIDLMLSVPYQTKQSVKSSLDTAIGLNPTHISAYTLILEKNTPFFNQYEYGRFPLPNEDEECEIFDTALSILEKNGYKRYEISNFSKDGFKCRHNLKYWNCDEYIGVGAAAHSYIDGRRFSVTEDFEKYLSNPCGAYENEQILSKGDMKSEYIMMRFRLTDGIIKDEFLKKFGFRFEEKYSRLNKKFCALGFMKETDGAVFLTKEGMRVSNSIICEYL